MNVKLHGKVDNPCTVQEFKDKRVREVSCHYKGLFHKWSLLLPSSEDQLSCTVHSSDLIGVLRGMLTAAILHKNNVTYMFVNHAYEPDLIVLLCVGVGR